MVQHPSFITSVQNTQATQMFGVPFDQLTSTEKASVFQAIQQLQQQLVNLPDDQGARLISSTPALMDFARQAWANQPELLNSLTNYAATNPSQPLPTIDKQRLDTDIWRTQQEIALAQQQGDANRAQQLQMQLNDLTLQREQMGGYMGDGQRTLEREESEFNRNLQLSQLAANPRNVGQWLSMMGMDPSATLGGSPMVQNARQQAGFLSPNATGKLGLPPTSGTGFDASGQWQQPNDPGMMYAQGGQSPSDGAFGHLERAGSPPPQPAPQMVDNRMGMPDVTTQGGPPANPDPYGNTPQFNFVEGRHAGYLNPGGTRGVLRDIQSNNESVPLYSGLASLSGRDPNAWWGQFAQSLPKGQKAAPTQMW